MNIVTLIGNLGNDVELRHLNDDRVVAQFRLAVDRYGKDAGADFFTIVTWNKQASSCAEYLSKGSRVAIDGRLRENTWTAQDGSKRSSVEVVANRVQFLSPPSNNSASANGDGEEVPVFDPETGVIIEEQAEAA